jgi:hypothetical protein
MADDKRKSPPKRAGASGGPGSGSSMRAGGGTREGTGGRQRGAAEAASSRDATDVAEQNAAGRGPGAGRDHTPPTAAGLGGATPDGDGLTAAALTASNLGDDALAAASEPILVVESLTVLSEMPMQGDGVAATDTTAAGGPVDAQRRWLMIAERAYLRAAERGFAPGGELEDWLYAEREVDGQLAGP